MTSLPRGPQIIEGLTHSHFPLNSPTFSPSVPAPNPAPPDTAPRCRSPPVRDPSSPLLIPDSRLLLPTPPTALQSISHPPATSDRYDSCNSPNPARNQTAPSPHPAAANYSSNNASSRYSSHSR